MNLPGIYMYYRVVAKIWWGGGGQDFFRDVLGGLGLCCPEKILKNGAIWCVLAYIFMRFCLKNLSKISIFNAKNNNSS